MLGRCCRCPPCRALGALGRAGSCALLLLLAAAWVPQTPPAPQDAMPPPRATLLTGAACEGAPWPKAWRFEQRDREAYERDGFLALRGFLTPEVTATLRREGYALCSHWPVPSMGIFSCSRAGVWARSDVARDFLYYGPVGETVRDFLGVDGVRIQEDGYFALESGYPGHAWHVDMAMYGGVYGDFHRTTRGATMFIALTDINATGAGGTLVVSRGGHKTGCVGNVNDPHGLLRRQYPLTPKPDNGTCFREIADGAVELSFRAGDALLYHPLMPHRTQAIAGHRMSWYARLVEADAVFCHRDRIARCSGGQPDCPHALRPGQRAHHACYQQVAPLLPEEVAERMRPGWQAPFCRWTMWDRILFYYHAVKYFVQLDHKQECVQ